MRDRILAFFGRPVFNWFDIVAISCATHLLRLGFSLLLVFLMMLPVVAVSVILERFAAHHDKGRRM